ncbi:MAG: hypothetical protein FJ112_07000 [Deltaproteobacteria bacterium]|nr:hypothetical protein [Deltaproteobacteria bacterium]
MLAANKVTRNKTVSNQMGTSMLFKATFLVLSFLVSQAGTLLAVPRPTIPNPGEDLKLTQGRPVAEFFAKRLENSQCQKELNREREGYLADRTHLENLVKQSGNAAAIDQAEETADKSRLALLQKIKECGPCATQDLDRKVVTTNKKEYWYLTDGSCYLGADQSQSTLDRYFDRAVARLKNITKYPGKRGGFKALLEFNEIDMQTGELLSPVDKIEKNPFYAFIGVRGPVALGIPVGFWYIFKNDVIERQQGDLKEFIIRFETVKKPANFPTPDLRIQSASGKLSSTMQRELTLAQGMWYVNNRGYMRYYTGADFGISLPFGIDFALNTLLDTLLTLMEDSVSQD